VGETLLEVFLATDDLSLVPVFDLNFAVDVAATELESFLCLLNSFPSYPPYRVAGGESCDFEISFFIQLEASFLAISVGKFLIEFLSIISMCFFCESKETQFYLTKSLTLSGSVFLLFAFLLF
jgi:hypothetical protein